MSTLKTPSLGWLLERVYWVTTTQLLLLQLEFHFWSLNGA